jgi:HSP20 family molecular chaperone IbpA
LDYRNGYARSLKDKIEIKASGVHLDVRGERKRKGQAFVYHEKFRLPDTLRSAEGITATTENGVLTVTIPKQASGVLQIPVN